MDKPRCYYCGKYVKTNPETRGLHWDVKTIYCYYPTPEPIYDEFWHIDCKNGKPPIKKEKDKENE